ncbi:unnamed protein product [Candida verbasci]|uniref:soluble epoxide hydrolase n=1 Tax=Candida verbasci TaxID=1227364 RepID=A0A9W4XKC6_9ASCO|nr:unnamed protein product [Candida verbasci]
MSKIIDKIKSKAHDIDPCTLSNYTKFQVECTELQLKVLFDEKILQGKVLFNLIRKENSINEVVLDSKYLKIDSVKVNNEKAKYEIAKEVPIYGSALTIPIKSNKIQLEIEFETTSKCSAIQFIQGDTGPFLFSQCEAIHARTLFPCFDTPAVKSIYKFIGISNLPVTMSGIPREFNKGEVYHFDQPIPIPSYLVSITSANLQKLSIGPRSDVYAEEPLITKCQFEFELDMENFLKIAENLVFDYEWGVFNALVLCLSYPYGGMEIPQYSQLTPTLICGDRSQLKVLAHELAHSWSGNLVTNETWEHFWLNEGWTVYLERRIIGEIAKLKAKERGLNVDPEIYGEEVRQFNMINGWNSLVETCSNFNPDFTKLVWNLKGKDPDDSFSKIPYEKGFFFLYHLEVKLGGLNEFDPFIKYYFKKFRYQSTNTAKFVETLYEFYPNKREILDSIDWDKWLFESGLPEEPKLDKTLANQVYSLVDKWVEFYYQPELFNESDIENFEVEQSILFLETLIEKFKNLEISPNIIKQFPKIYPSYHKSLNGEIVSAWNDLLITYGDYESADDVVINFASWLGTVGRMKYVRPGYKVLVKGISKDYAIAVFQKHKDFYHPICRTMVMKDLGIN